MEFQSGSNDLYTIYIFIPAVIGFCMDLLLGDPSWYTHPVVLIGRIISTCENILYDRNKNLFFRGMLTWIITAAVSAGAPAALLAALSALPLPDACGHICGKILIIAVSSVMCWNMIAYKGLKDAGKLVYNSLGEGLSGGRSAISMFVGRDTDNLDEKGVIRAAAETISENTCDGVIAPLFYMAVFGLPGMYLYKAANTMDSMLGYRNEKYELFGRFSARADDALNFIPSRISAVLMIISSMFICGADTKNALKIFFRDRYNTPSPNSGQTESVCAGALRIQLGGPVSYGGILHNKKFIGDNIDIINKDHIKSANRLLTGCTFLFMMFYTLFAFIIQMLKCF